MFDHVAAAQVFHEVPQASSASLLEETLRVDLIRFNAEQPALDRVLESCGKLRAPQSARAVANAMSAEAFRLLKDADRLLAIDQPYRTRQIEFADWDGASPPSPGVWGARDAAELAVYLDATRARVAFLAGSYAKPLLSWLTKVEGGMRPDMRPLVSKWQGIVDDLRDYETKRPGNSVAALEDFIANRMTKVSVVDCSAATLPSSFRAGGSHFANTLIDLSRELRQRCTTLAGRDAIGRYAELERHFNQRLAGRYPFSEHRPRSGELEADPADIRGFFRLFDDHRAVIAATAAQGGLDRGQGPARTFVEQMTEVRKFFSSFLDAPKPELAPSLDLEATFRVLKTKEIEGDQIIGWTVAVGDSTITNRDADRKLRWTGGRPVTLSLRWAQDAPRVPMVAPTGGAVLRERTMVWRYEGRWALLAALADHRTRSEDLPTYADVEPVTLAFDASTKPAGGPDSDAQPTKVFMRLALLAPGTTTPVDVPRFPVRAPRIAVEEAR
jgi:type VI secretion system protein ImpL